MTPLDPAVLDELSQFSTPSVLNGLKRLGVPPERFETMSRHEIRCLSPSAGTRVGFAATRTVATRRSGPPHPNADPTLTMARQHDAVFAVPAPRILVVENVGDADGPVCIWGEVAATINQALGCVAGITNGPVRDVPECDAIGFAFFAGGVDVGGGYVDTVAAGAPVRVGGVTVAPGDLLLGDVHGVVKIPIEHASALPAAIRAHEAIEARVIAVARSPHCSAGALGAAWAEPR